MPRFRRCHVALHTVLSPITLANCWRVNAKKGKADVTVAGGGANQVNNPTLTPLTAAANARAEIDSTRHQPALA